MTTYQPAPDTRERFLQGKLSESETSQFELWLADHPDELEILELDLLMQEGLKNNRTKQSGVMPIAAVEHNRRSVWIWTTPLLLIGVVAFYLLLQPVDDGFEQRLSDAVYVPVEVMRGSNDEPLKIHLGGTDQDLVLMIPGTDAQTTRATLRLKLDTAKMHSGYRIIRKDQQTWVVLRRDQLADGQVLKLEQLNARGEAVFTIQYALVESGQ
jgi:hypothetical protein